MKFISSPLYACLRDGTFFRLDHGSFVIDADVIYNDGTNYRNTLPPIPAVSAICATGPTIATASVMIGSGDTATPGETLVGVVDVARVTSTSPIIKDDRWTGTAPRQNEYTRRERLFCSLGRSYTAGLTNASANVILLSTAFVEVGMAITGTNIPTGAFVVSITSSTVIVISMAATATASVTATIGGQPMTLLTSVTTVNLSPLLTVLTVTSFKNMQDLYPIGSDISGTGIPTNAKIIAHASVTTILISASCTAAATVVATITPPLVRARCWVHDFLKYSNTPPQIVGRTPILWPS